MTEIKSLSGCDALSPYTTLYRCILLWTRNTGFPMRHGMVGLLGRFNRLCLVREGWLGISCRG